jgi:hypothetical protein
MSVGSLQANLARRGVLLRPVLLAASLLLALAPAGAQQNTPPPPQSAPAAPAMPPVPSPGDESGAPFQPVPLTQPTPPADQNVNATGGIITNHAPDVFTRSETYTPTEVQNDAPEPSQPAPPPIEEVVARPPDLVGLNVNAASVQNSALHPGVLKFGVETTGTYTSNLFNTFSPIQGGGYFDFGFPVTFYKEGPTTNYTAVFRADVSSYPGNGELNHTSEVFSQDLSHQTSELTKWDWQIAGGKIVTVGDYLPSVIAIGTTGVAQGQFANGLEPIYNAATTLTYTHRLSEENTLIASATGGWLEEPYDINIGTNLPAWSREATAGADLQFQHALSPGQAVGAELSEIYVKGLTPVGNSDFTSLKATYQRAISAHSSLHLGIGPLYSNSSVAESGYPASSGFSYTADASYDFQTSLAKMSVGYQRIIEAGYLGPPTTANSYYFSFDRPLTPTLELTADARDTRLSSATGESGVESESYSDFGVTARLTKHLTPNLMMFVGGDSFRQSALNENLNRNDATGGISYTFGNPFARF